MPHQANNRSSYFDKVLKFLVFSELSGEIVSYIEEQAVEKAGQALIAAELIDEAAAEEALKLFWQQKKLKTN